MADDLDEFGAEHVSQIFHGFLRRQIGVVEDVGLNQFPRRNSGTGAVDDGIAEAVLADLIARDERDSNRAIAPLRPADDAVLLDTSGMTLQESIDAILKLIRKKVTV